MPQPRLLVTRKLPDAVEARARRDYDALLNAEDRALRPRRSGPAGPGRGRGADLPHGALDAGAGRATARRGCGSSPRSRSATSISISPACRGARDRRHQHARRADRGHGRHRHALPARRRASRLGGRRLLLRERRWERPKMAELLGLELRGRVLGIVGMGRIGQALARRARGFGLADPLPQPPAAAGRRRRKVQPTTIRSKVCCPAATSCRSTARAARRPSI